MANAIDAELTWTKKASAEIIPKLEAYRDAVFAAAKRVFDEFARRIRDYAVQNRKWTDRTTAAKNGLRTKVTVAGTLFTLTLYHTVDYGIWLEVANGGKYGIILDTLTTMFPQLMTFLAQTIRGV